MQTAEKGLKVIIADGECQLARQRRVRAEDAEKLEPGQARRARALRRRRRDLHRRPFLHPPVGLPVADGQALARSAARRPGGDRDRQLRRLRPVRRGRPRRGAVPVVLPRRDRPQRRLARPHASSLARRGDRLAQPRHAPASPPPPAAVTVARRKCLATRTGLLRSLPPRIQAGTASKSGNARQAADRRARRRRRRRADQLDRGGGGGGRLAGAEHLDPRRRPAHRRHHLLHRDPAGAGRKSSAASGRCWRSRPASATSTWR